MRAFYTGWYRELVTHVPQPVNGSFARPPGPALREATENVVCP